MLNMDINSIPEAQTTAMPGTDQTALQSPEHHNPVTGLGPVAHTYNNAEDDALDAAMQELDQLDDERIGKNLLIFQWFKEQHEKLKTNKAEADTAQKDLREAAEKAIQSLSPEESQAIIRWIGARDRAQQYQGALNFINRVMTPVHNLNAGTLSAQIIVAKLRRENNRIRELALANGVKLPRSITRRRR